MPTKPTPSTKHTKRRSPPTKLLRLSVETHRALKWVALKRGTTMGACLAKLVNQALAKDNQAAERRAARRANGHQPTAQVA